MHRYSCPPYSPQADGQFFSPPLSYSLSLSWLLYSNSLCSFLSRSLYSPLSLILLFSFFPRYLSLVFSFLLSVSVSYSSVIFLSLCPCPLFSRPLSFPRSLFMNAIRFTEQFPLFYNYKIMADCSPCSSHSISPDLRGQTFMVRVSCSCMPVCLISAKYIFASCSLTPG